MDIREWLLESITANNQGRANEWFQEQVLDVVSKMGGTKENAEATVRASLGMVSGNFDIAVARQVFKLYGAVHPILGTPDQREDMTAADILNAGIRWGAANALAEINEGKRIQVAQTIPEA
jgi:hypothetical protein